MPWVCKWLGPTTMHESGLEGAPGMAPIRTLHPWNSLCLGAQVAQVNTESDRTSARRRHRDEREKIDEHTECERTALHERPFTLGTCGQNPETSKNWPCKAERDFFPRNPSVRGDIVFLLFAMAAGEPTRQDPSALKELAAQTRGPGRWRCLFCRWPDQKPLR